LGPGLLIPYSIAGVAVVIAVSLIAQRAQRDRAAGQVAGSQSTSVASRTRDTLRAPALPAPAAATQPTTTPNRDVRPAVPAPPQRAPDTTARRPVSLPRDVLADALAIRRRAADAGATPADLGPGDASMDAAQSLARAGRLADAIRRMSDATSSWRAAENAVQARVSAMEQSRAQVTPPVVTQAPPVAPSAAGVPTPPVAEDARSAIEAVIDEYARAIASRDVAAVRRVYRGLTPAQQRAWEQFFQSTDQIQADLSIASLEQSGLNADVSVAGTFDYVLRGTDRREHRTVFFRSAFKRENGTWRMVTVR
jgi:hypothetical protein